MESTGNMWIVMYEKLKEQGLNLCLANPLKTRAIAKAKIKHDKLDAWRVCHVKIYPDTEHGCNVLDNCVQLLQNY